MLAPAGTTVVTSVGTDLVVVTPAIWHMHLTLMAYIGVMYVRHSSRVGYSHWSDVLMPHLSMQHMHMLVPCVHESTANLLK